MLSISLTAEQTGLLDAMAKETARTPEDVARRAVLDAMEDYEDYKIAAERLRTSDGTTYSLEELLAKYPEDEHVAK